jgi:hypothetical protein
MAPERDSTSALGQVILLVPGMQWNRPWGVRGVRASDPRLRLATTRVRLLDGCAHERVWLAYI